MVTHLMESNARSHRSFGAALPSLAFHSVLILAAIQVTAHSSLRRLPTPPQHYIDVLYDPPKTVQIPPAPSDRRSTTVSNAARNPSSITVSSPALPQLDISGLTREMPVAVVSKNEFDGGGVSGTNAPSGIANGGRAFSLNQVDAQAEPLGDNPAPRYPESLRAAAIRGIVLAQFVVDTTGRVEAGSFVALRADNYLFAESVKAALAKARFHPAQVGGRPVRQLVQQSFSFMLE